MLFIGERLYGDGVRRDPSRALELLTQAKRQGRPVAGDLLEHAASAIQGKRGQ